MDNCCADCVHYIQHYRLDNRKYHELGVGHCDHSPRGKQVRQRQDACEYFVPRAGGSANAEPS